MVLIIPHPIISMIPHQMVSIILHQIVSIIPHQMVSMIPHHPIVSINPHQLFTDLSLKSAVPQVGYETIVVIVAELLVEVVDFAHRLHRWSAKHSYVC